jgi:hypothetical protein
VARACNLKFELDPTKPVSLAAATFHISNASHREYRIAASSPRLIAPAIPSASHRKHNIAEV